MRTGYKVQRFAVCCDCAQCHDGTPNSSCVTVQDICSEHLPSDASEQCSRTLHGQSAPEVPIHGTQPCKGLKENNRHTLGLGNFSSSTVETIVWSLGHRNRPNSHHQWCFFNMKVRSSRIDWWKSLQTLPPCCFCSMAEYWLTPV